MNLKSLASNFSVAVLAQGVGVLISIVSSLVVPGFLGVEQYGYWQLFVFYASYVGFFHLGINDGVYLINGGVSRDEIDKHDIACQFVVSLVYEALFSVAIIAIASMMGLEPQRSYVVIATAVYLLVLNAANYIGFVFQAMNETQRYSISTIIGKVTFAIPMAICLVLGLNTSEPYIASFVAGAAFQLAYCLYYFQDFLAALGGDFGGVLSSVAESIRVGIRLTVSNISGSLILGVSRMVVDRIWGIAAFGQLSISFSCVTFFLLFISQAAMVLFPALRQSEEGQLSRYYEYSRDGTLLFMPAVYALYFPIVILLVLWLPQYAEGLSYFAFLLPFCIFEGNMSIAAATYFKVNRQENILLALNLGTLAISAVGALLGGFVFGSIQLILATAILAVVLRSVAADILISRDLHRQPSHVFVGTALLSIVFVLAAWLLHPAVAFVVFVAGYAGYLFFYRETLTNCMDAVSGLLH